MQTEIMEAINTNEATAQATEREKKTAGAQTLIKQLLLKNPKLTNDELVEQLRAKGFKVSAATVSTISSGFRHSIKVIQAAGMLKKIRL